MISCRGRGHHAAAGGARIACVIRPAATNVEAAPPGEVPVEEEGEIASGGPPPGERANDPGDPLPI